MTVTGFVFVAAGTAAFLFIAFVDAEMRSRAREQAAPTKAVTAVPTSHHAMHAMPLRADLAITFRAAALAVLVELAALIDNLTAPMRGIA